jgi:hypothetical protein
MPKRYYRSEKPEPRDATPDPVALPYHPEAESPPRQTESGPWQCVVDGSTETGAKCVVCGSRRP